MNIVVLMAGEGRRFTEKGFKTLKPLIEVDGKPIVEWTLSSLPLKSVKHKLWFAVKSEHCEKFPLVERISEIFPEANFIFLTEKQQGNLFSGFQAFSELPESAMNEPLLFLDADNHYDGSLFFDFVLFMKYKDLDYGCVVSFKPLDESIRWGFVIPSKKQGEETRFRASGFMEKDTRALEQGGLPMMGAFYFSSGELFEEMAKNVLGRIQQGEYYMTQAMQELLNQDYQVYNYITPFVAPMGTPEDLKVFEGPYWMN